MKTELKRFRIERALDELVRKPCYFWTFTTSDVVSYEVIAKRWRDLRHFLREKYKALRYVQNFEVHPLGHGWHIHLVCDLFLDLRNKSLYNKIQGFGFGRVNVKRVYSSDVSAYLSKHAFKAYRGLPERSGRIRLVNLSRNLEMPLSRFKCVFGLSDRWQVVKGNFYEKKIAVPFSFER